MSILSVIADRTSLITDHSTCSSTATRCMDFCCTTHWKEERIAWKRDTRDDAVRGIEKERKSQPETKIRLHVSRSCTTNSSTILFTLLLPVHSVRYTHLIIITYTGRRRQMPNLSLFFSTLHFLLFYWWDTSLSALRHRLPYPVGTRDTREKLLSPSFVR